MKNLILISMLIALCNANCPSNQQWCVDTCCGVTQTCNSNNKCGCLSHEQQCSGTCCNSNQTCWNNTCVTKCASSHQQCGSSCCSLNELCWQGSCVQRCSKAIEQCGSSCCNSPWFCDNGHCSCHSSCGSSCCSSSQTCWNNQCVTSCSSSLQQCGSSCCNSSQTCMSNQCVPKCQFSSQQCGSSCCSSSQTCWNGQCVQKCQNSSQQCASSCCPNSQVCNNGECMFPTLCFENACGLECCTSNQYCNFQTSHCENTSRNCTSGFYITYQAGDWGQQCESNRPAACIRDASFSNCFPTGLQLGCVHEPGNRVAWNSISALADFLPQLGSNHPLAANYTNPGKWVNSQQQTTIAGVFGGSLAGLALNLGFDECSASNFSNGCNRLRNLYVCDSGQSHFVLNNWRCNLYYNSTVGEIFNLGNEAIGGCCPSSTNSTLCNVDNLNSCVEAISAAFNGGQILLQRFHDNEFTTSGCPPILNS